MPHIYGIGETVYDIIFRNGQPERAVPGGSTFNALISLGRCGHCPVMVTETGDDHVGRLIIDFMHSAGVSTDHVTVRPSTKTHISLAFLDQNGDAHYTFYKDHASADVEPHYPDFQTGDLVLFGSFFAVNPVIRPFTSEFLHRAAEAGCILYYDVNFRPAHADDLPNVLCNIRENIALATIVRGSTEDFATIFGTSDPVAVWNDHLGCRPALFICTAGSGDVTTITADGHIAYHSAQQIEVVSTIGAGDNFNAGFLHALASFPSPLSHARDKISEVSGLHRLLKESEGITSLVAAGQRFAAKVCRSYDNYVTPDFAHQLQAERLAACKALLFDLDGVIIDTESQYERFWGEIGRRYHPEIADFATRIKGSTLVAIHETYFSDSPELRAEINRQLDAFEASIVYELFPGVEKFLAAARSTGRPMAIVTSSNLDKMASLAQQQPTLTTLFDHVFTAEDAGRGKPYPDCYLRAAAHFGLDASECAVFEDSINGLCAARASGAYVVGLTTTHPAETVAPLADFTINGLGEIVDLL